MSKIVIIPHMEKGDEAEEMPRVKGVGETGMERRDKKGIITFYINTRATPGRLPQLVAY